MIDQNSIIAEFLKTQGASSGPPSGAHGNITLGVVIDTDDPLQNFRLRVFCPSFNDDPKQLQYIPWSVYGSPFAGSINNPSYTRGTGDGTAESQGAIHYGMSAIPELGAQVLVACIDGDYRRRVWLACVPQHQETNSIHTGRWKWNAGSVDGPLTSEDKPIQPIYDNVRQAFQNKTDSPEWKTRIADYQHAAIRDDFGQVPNSKKQTYKDQTNKTLTDNETEEWIKKAIGSHGYDWTGFKSVGAMLSSRAFGFSTPGFHAFTLDDRPFNSRVMLRTGTGHRIILDDTNERIYVATHKGNNWIELDGAGNIDMYSEARISISGNSDLNLTGKTVRIHGRDSVNIYAGHTMIDDKDSISLNERLPFGTVAITAESELIQFCTNMRSYCSENSYFETGLNYFAKIGDSSTLTVTGDNNVSTVNGDHIVSSGNSIYTTSKAVTKMYSESSMSMGAYGDYEAQSFSGATSVTGSTSTRIKAANGNLDMEAGMSNGQGTIGMYSPGSQMSVSENGVSIVSSGNITTVSASEIASAVQPGFTLDNANALGLVLASANVNINKITGTNIFTNVSLGDLIRKTAQRGHSYNFMGDQIDMLTQSVNILTAQVGTMYNAIQAAITALSGSISLSFTFDIACALERLYSFLPQEVLDAFATYQDMKQAIEDLGYAVNDLNDLIDALQNPMVLSGLGLPPLDLSASLLSSSCTPGMPLFQSQISYNVPLMQTPEVLRELMDNIYAAGSQIGQAPALSALSWDK